MIGGEVLRRSFVFFAIIALILTASTVVLDHDSDAETTYHYSITVQNGTSDKTEGDIEAGNDLIFTFTPNQFFYRPDAITVSIGGAAVTEDVEYTYDRDTCTVVVKKEYINGNIGATISCVRMNVEYTVTVNDGTSDKTSGSTGAGLDFEVNVSPSQYHVLPAAITVTIDGVQCTQGTEYTYDSILGNITVRGQYVTGEIGVIVTCPLGETDYTIDLTDGTQLTGRTAYLTDFEIELEPSKHYLLPVSITVKVDGSDVEYTYIGGGGISGSLSIIGSKIIGPINVTGVCTVASYTISYDYGGGSGVDMPTTGQYMTDVIIPAPEKADYLFRGWMVDSGLDPECAKWGIGGATMPVTSETMMSNGLDGSIAVKDLASWPERAVTLKAYWYTPIQKPTADERSFVFNGEMQTYEPIAFDSDTMGITGNTKMAAGTTPVVVSILYKDQNIWADGTSDDVTFSFTIQVLYLSKPASDPTVFYYTGEPLTYQPSPFLEKLLSIDGNVKTLSGIYDVTVSLRYPDSEFWAGGTSETLHYDFIINKAILAKPTEDPNTHTYTGEEQTYVPYGFDDGTMIKVNDKRTVAGSQTVTISIIDVSNYEWTGGTSDDLSFTFVMLKRLYAVPDAGKKTYNCELQKSDLEGVADIFTVTANEGGTDAGTYDVSIRLCDDYFQNNKWETSEDQEIIIDFVIERAELESITTDVYYNYTSQVQIPGYSNLVFTGYSVGPAYTSVTIVLNGTDGKSAGTQTVRVTVESDTNFKDYSADVNYTILKGLIVRPMADTSEFVFDRTEQEYKPVFFYESLMTISGNLRTDAGTQTVTVDLKDKDNTIWADETYDPSTFEFTIKVRNLALPAADGTTFTYNGEEQTYVPQPLDLDYMTVTGDKRMNAGTQDVTVALNDKVNTIWSNETTDDVVFVFTILKKTYSLPAAGSKVFNEHLQKSDLTGVEGDYEVTKNNGGTNAGNYDVCIRLFDEKFQNYKWSSSEEQEVTIYFVITKATITEVTVEHTYYYTGEIQIPGVGHLRYTGFTLGPGDSYVSIAHKEGTDGKSAGTHYAIVTVADDINFNDCTKEVEYEILKAKLGIPEPDIDEFKYDGQPKSIVFTGYDPETMGIDGDGKVNVGFYREIVRLLDKSNYTWADDSQNELIFLLTITKGTYDMTGVRFVDGSAVYDGTPQHHYVTGTLPTGADGIQITVSYEGSATYVEEGIIMVKAIFTTTSFNYSDPELMISEFQITPRTVFVSGLQGVQKTYDGTCDITVSSEEVVIDGQIPGDELSVEVTAHLSSKNCGPDREVIIDTIVLVGAKNPNYSLDESRCQKVAYADVLRAEIKIIGVTASDKVYDGTTAAEFTGEPYLETVFETDDVTVIPGIANFSDKNVGESKDVIYTGFLLTGTDSDNYTGLMPDNGSANISKKLITISNGPRIIAREYDGTTEGVRMFVGEQFVFSGVISGDEVDLADKTSVYDDPTVYATSVTVTSIELTNGNYYIEEAVLVAHISSRPITLANGPEEVTKIYDGTTAAPEMTYGVHYMFANIIDGDSVDFVNKSFIYSRADVTSASVSSKTSSLDNLNYRFVSSTITAKIEPKPLELISGTEGVYKEYDGTDVLKSMVRGVNYELSGIVGSDRVEIIDTESIFDLSDVHATKITLKNGELDNSNYVLGNDVLDAKIVQREVKILGVYAKDKVFDNTTDAEIGGTPRLSWVNSGDDVSIITGIGTFDSKDTGKRTVTFSGFAIDGEDSENYLLSEQPAPVTAEITSTMNEGGPAYIIIGSIAIICMIAAAGLIFIRK